MSDDPRQLPDAALLHASAAGDARAFGELVRRYQHLARAVAFAAVGDPGSSEDVAQNAFVTAYRRLGELRDPDSFRAWLCGIARNEARAYRRHLRRHAPAGGPLDDAAELACDGPTPIDAALSRERAARVAEALRRIPARYREPLVLFYRERQSVRQVADDLGLTEAAVKQRLARGRRRLAGQLDQLGQLDELGERAPRRDLGAAVAAVIAAGAAGSIRTAVAAPSAKLAAIAAAFAAVTTLSAAPPAPPPARALHVAAPAARVAPPPPMIAAAPVEPARVPAPRRRAPRGVVEIGVAHTTRTTPAAPRITAPVVDRPRLEPHIVQPPVLRLVDKMDDI